MTQAPAVDGVETAEWLATQLGSRRWIKRSEPFPHVVVHDVFTGEVYARLEGAFRAALRGTRGQPYLEKHDIKGRTLMPDLAADFAPLISRAWNDVIANVLGLDTTGYVACGLHHHEVGSSHGFPHNDFNPGWGNGPAPADGVQLMDDTVDYTTGEPRAPGAAPVEMVRAASLLFYLANPPWQPGDGGMTGLYRSANDDIEQPAAFAPPINNSMLAFECMPASFHGFISNRNKPRNSIVMWLHQTKENATARWGEGSIVPYGVAPPLRRTR